MGCQTIVYGRIVLRNQSQSDQDAHETARAFIKGLNDNATMADYYPWITTEMFSLGTAKSLYYREPVFAFAVTYKELEEGYFAAFIAKFEYILKNIPFDTVKLEMETELYGSYNLFWKHKYDGDRKEPEEYLLIETDSWYFGYGHRFTFGNLEVPLSEKHIYNLYEFEYPLESCTSLIANIECILKKIAEEKKVS